MFFIMLDQFSDEFWLCCHIGNSAIAPKHFGINTARMLLAMFLSSVINAAPITRFMGHVQGTDERLGVAIGQLSPGVLATLIEYFDLSDPLFSFDFSPMGDLFLTK